MSPLRAWLIAIRPATLLASFSPVVVGSALAWADDEFRWDALGVTLLAAVAIQIAVNLANDVADARRGVDSPQRIGPQRAVAAGLLQPQQVWRGVWAAFAIAIAAGLYLTAIAGWVVIVIGIASIAAALGYSSGPAPYGSLALGELFVFVFFGPVATVGARFAHSERAPLDAWLLAIPVGFLITAILVANNIRDIDTDGIAGKRTLAVALGRTRTRRLYAALLVAAFLLLVVYGAIGAIPRGMLLGLVAGLWAPRLIRTINRRVEGAPLIAALKGTVQMQAAFGFLAAVGAVIGSA